MIESISCHFAYLKSGYETVEERCVRSVKNHLAAMLSSY